MGGYPTIWCLSVTWMVVPLNFFSHVSHRQSTVALFVSFTLVSLFESLIYSDTNRSCYHREFSYSVLWYCINQTHFRMLYNLPSTHLNTVSWKLIVISIICLPYQEKLSFIEDGTTNNFPFHNQWQFYSLTITFQ